MKKIFGVIVAVSLCMCLLLPSAFAAESTTSFEDYFAGVDFSGYSLEELESLFAGYDLGDFDLAEFYNSLKPGEDETTEAEEETEEETTTEATEETSGVTLDLTWLTDLITSFNTDSMLTMFEDFDVSNLDELLTVVSDTMASAGIDLSIFDLSAVGNLDITTLLQSTTGSDSATYTTTDVMAGLADTLLAGLESLGLDTTTIEALLDNEIVNFFANLYIGYVDGVVPEETTTAPTTAEPTTVPPVVTTSVPETGETSAVVTAIATLSIASAAAFVCLKKKED